MATILKLGPKANGRALTLAEFLSADYKTGYKYELIDGRLDVSPGPSFNHQRYHQDLYGRFVAYVLAAPDVANYVAFQCRVFVPGVERTTCPEPDIAVYESVPLGYPTDSDWQDFSPMLVVEVMGAGCVEKDLGRNVDLYARVPSIREYLVLDIRDPARPSLIVHVRRARGWSVRTIPHGGVYTTKLLPGFRLVVDSRQPG